jgi:hypothetical protein
VSANIRCKWPPEESSRRATACLRCIDRKRACRCDDPPTQGATRPTHPRPASDNKRVHFADPLEEQETAPQSRTARVVQAPARLAPPAVGPLHRKPTLEEQEPPPRPRIARLQAPVPPAMAPLNREPTLAVDGFEETEIKPQPRRAAVADTDYG